MKSDPQAVLASIPGWEDAQVEALSGGLTNETWLVQADPGKAVLKIDAAPRSAPYNDRLEEARIQTSAAGVGLAGKVLHAGETVLLTAYVEGETWQPADLAADAKLVQLGQALRSLHSLPLCGRAFDAVAAAHQYRDAIRNADPVLVEQNVAVIESMQGPGKRCFCHNDLVAGNIVSTPQVKLLDWEYAGDNDPFFDLATVVAHHALSNAQAGTLLDAYFDGDGMRWRNQLAAQERVYDALHWLWAAARRSPAVA